MIIRIGHFKSMNLWSNSVPAHTAIPWPSMIYIMMSVVDCPSW